MRVGWMSCWRAPATEYRHGDCQARLRLCATTGLHNLPGIHVHLHVPMLPYVPLQVIENP